MSLCLAAWVPAAAQTRSETHEKYAAALWKSLHPASGPKYVRWPVAPRAPDLPVGPPSGPGAKTYLNAAAAAAAGALPHGSVVVTEHLGTGGDKPAALTIRYRFQNGYHPASDDWYWATYLPDGKLVRTVADKAPYDKQGFAAYLQDGRLWVLRLGSEALVEYLTSGEPAKRVIRPGAGPGGLTIMSDGNATIDAYLTSKPGFETRVADGRLWVFPASSKELAEFEKHGELAKHVIRPGAGPAGMTIKAPEAEIIDAYLTAAEGFETRLREGRVWVFRPGSAELAEFEKSGDLAKHVTRPGAGPQGMTVKAADAETLDAYLRAAAGSQPSDG
jgi:hypothetical protein